MSMKIGPMNTIDFARVTKIPKFKVNVKQGDSKRTIQLRLLSNGETLNLENYTVTVAAVKEDGNDIFNDVTVIDPLVGLCEVEVTKQMLALNTDLPCEIVLYESDGTVASSSNFVISRISSLRNEESIVSSNEFTALIRALSDVTYIKTNIANKLDKNAILSMSNMGQDVKEAMTGNSVAVVGKHSVSGINMTESSRMLMNNIITYDITKFEQGSINSNGNMESGVRIRSIDYIEVIPNTKFILKVNNNNYKIGLYLYKKDKTFSKINWIGYYNSSTEFITDSETYFIRLIIGKSSDFAITVNELLDTDFSIFYNRETTLLALKEDYESKINSSIKPPKYDNLIPFDTSKWFNGTLMNGVPKDSNIRLYSDYLELDNAYYILKRYNDLFDISMDVYDSNKVYLKWYTYNFLEQPYKFNFNEKYCRLLIKFKDDRTISTNDVIHLDATIKKELELYIDDAVTENKLDSLNKIKIMSFNSGGYWDGISSVPSENLEEHKISYRKMFANNDCDLVFLQEYIYYFDEDHTTIAYDSIMKYRYPYLHKIGTGSSANYGLALLSKSDVENITITSLVSASNSQRGFLKCYKNINGKNICLINTHLSYDVDFNLYRKAQILRLIEEMNKEEYVILCGDFNTYSKEELQLFTDAGYLLCNEGYYGSFYTWHNLDRPSSWTNKAIDNIVVSNNIFINNVYVDECRLSDHDPIITELFIK